MMTLRNAAPHKELVLLVDPDDHDRVLYGASLRLAEFDVDEASDGREALVRAAARPPTLVVTATRLAFIDGYTLCAMFRNDPPTRDARIIVLTADGLPVHVDRARDAGADVVLVKPCQPEQLIVEIERLSVESHEKSAGDAAAGEAPLERPMDLLAFSREKRRTYVRDHQRFETTTPPLQPPDLRCPSCYLALKYERSHIGGVSDRHSEQWDYYSCTGSCGTFQYRQRTRKLRPAG